MNPFTAACFVLIQLCLITNYFIWLTSDASIAAKALGMPLTIIALSAAKKAFDES
jgi:hypothetical protein